MSTIQESLIQVIAPETAEFSNYLHPHSTLTIFHNCGQHERQPGSHHDDFSDPAQPSFHLFACGGNYLLAQPLVLSLPYFITYRQSCVDGDRAKFRALTPADCKKFETVPQCEKKDVRSWNRTSGSSERYWPQRSDLTPNRYGRQLIERWCLVYQSATRDPFGDSRSLLLTPPTYAPCSIQLCFSFSV